MVVAVAVAVGVGMVVVVAVAVGIGMLVAVAVAVGYGGSLIRKVTYNVWISQTQGCDSEEGPTQRRLAGTRKVNGIRWGW